MIHWMMWMSGKQQIHLSFRSMKHLAKYSHQDYYICSKRSLVFPAFATVIGRGALFPQEGMCSKSHGNWGSEATIRTSKCLGVNTMNLMVLNQKKELIWDLVHRQWTANYDFNGRLEIFWAYVNKRYGIFRDGWRNVPNISFHYP